MLVSNSTNVNNKNDNKFDDFKEDICHCDWTKWKKAIRTEYISLIENETWELTAIPKNYQGGTS